MGYCIWGFVYRLVFTWDYLILLLLNLFYEYHINDIHKEAFIILSSIEV